MRYRYEHVEVLDIYDADTITVIIDLGFNVLTKVKLRLFGINAPEMRGSEKKRGTAARDYLRERLAGQTVALETHKLVHQGKYGRYLAEVYIDDVNINEELVIKGHAEFKIYGQNELSSA